MVAPARGKRGEKPAVENEANPSRRPGDWRTLLIGVIAFAAAFWLLL